MAYPTPATPGYAADQLWKHQLRQEHAACVKTIHDLESKLSLVQHNFIEVEANVYKLKSELERKIEDDKQKYLELQTQILDLISSRYPAVSREEFQRMTQEQLRQEKQPDIGSAPVSHELQDAPTESAVPSLAVSSIEPSPPEEPMPPLATSSVEHPPQEVPIPSRRISNRKAVAAIKRPNTRQSQRHQVRSSTTITRQLPSPISTIVHEARERLPEKLRIKSFSLSQKHRSMDAYFIHADKIHSTYSDLEQEEEFRFVNSFIRGINSQEKTKALQIELEMGFHRSRTNSEGQVDILCNWKDIKPALLKIKKANKRQKVS